MPQRRAPPSGSSDDSCIRPSRRRRSASDPAGARAPPRPPANLHRLHVRQRHRMGRARAHRPQQVRPVRGDDPGPARREVRPDDGRAPSYGWAARPQHRPRAHLRRSRRDAATTDRRAQPAPAPRLRAANEVAHRLPLRAPPRATRATGSDVLRDSHRALQVRPSPWGEEELYVVRTWWKSTNVAPRSSPRCRPLKCKGRQARWPPRASAARTAWRSKPARPRTARAGSHPVAAGSASCTRRRYARRREGRDLLLPDLKRVRHTGRESRGRDHVAHRRSRQDHTRTTQPVRRRRRRGAGLLEAGHGSLSRGRRGSRTARLRFVRPSGGRNPSPSGSSGRA